MSHQKWIDAAEVFDSWRVIPRAVLLGYCWWTVYLVDKLTGWYMHIPVAERAVETAGFAGAVITAVTGMGAFVFKIYSDNGRDWNSRQDRPAEAPLTQR